MEQVTERERAEERLRQVPAMLEKEVADRTAELARINIELEKEISERKKAEGALHKSKEYAEKLIQTANVLIVGLDPEGNIVVFNEGRSKSPATPRRASRENLLTEVLPRGLQLRAGKI